MYLANIITGHTGLGLEPTFILVPAFIQKYSVLFYCCYGYLVFLQMSYPGLVDVYSAASKLRKATAQTLLFSHIVASLWPDWVRRCQD